MIAAIVLDLDGVLIDSEPVWEEVRRGLVAERDGHWPAEAQSRLMGMSTPEWAQYLSAELGVGLPPEQVASTVVARMASRYAKTLPLMPAATEALHRLAAQWPLGLASSSPRTLIDTVLRSAGWTQLFRVTVSTEEVGHGKPDPEVYLSAAAQLGVPAESCAAVEDSSNGLRSAAAAGMRVIAVPHPRYPPTPDALELAGAVAPTLAELTIATIRDA